MKPNAQLRRLLPFLAFVASLQITLGYYDPAAQRWINRDPIAEWGGINLHLHSRNTPVGSIDAFGLFIWSGCTEQEKGEIKKQFKQTCDAAKKSDCFAKCKLSSDGQKKMKDTCSEQNKDGSGPEVECLHSGSRDCMLSKLRPGMPCGATDNPSKKGMPGKIKLCMDNRRAEGCNSLGCVLLHESAHSVGGVGPDVGDGLFGGPDNRAYELEDCAGCNDWRPK